MDEQARFTCFGAGRDEAPQFGLQVVKQRLLRFGATHRKTDTTGRKGRARKRTQVEPDHRALQPAARGRNHGQVARTIRARCFDV